MEAVVLTEVSSFDESSDIIQSPEMIEEKPKKKKAKVSNPDLPF